MRNDLGGAAKSLWSVDNGVNNSGAMNGYIAADLLTQDTARTEALSSDTSLNGARIWITADGKIGYDASTLTAAFRGSLQSLATGQDATDSFIYAIRLGNGALSWATAVVHFRGTDDGPAITISGSTPTASITEGSGPGGVEQAGGSILFSDTDLADTHTVSPSGPSFSWSGGTLSASQQLALTTASQLQLTEHDSTGSGTGSIGWNYSISDGALGFLGAGQTLAVSYTVTIDDGHGGVVGQQVTVTINGTTESTPPSISTPTIDGVAQEGQTLTATATAGHAADVVSYAWYSSADGYTNPIGTGATYVVKEADEGFTIEVKATSTNDNGATATATSVPTAAVADNAAIAVSVVVNGGGAVQEGQTLVASGTISGDSDDLTAPITYQWQSSSNNGLTWTNVAATTTGTFNGVVSSFYQLGESDEGKIFRATASFTNDTGQVVVSTSNATATVADRPLVLSIPFSYAVDDFKIVKNGSLLGDDNFSAGPPPIAGVFSGTPVAFATSASTGGSTWSYANGKAIMSSSGAIQGGVGAFVQAILLTNTASQGTGAGQSNSGLKQNSTFTLSTTFDLTLPPLGGGGYGIMLTNTAPGVAATEVVELMVQRSASGTANIVLLQQNQATNTTTTLASLALTSQQTTGNTQIELDLAHNTAGSTAITGSFELFNNGVQTFANTFTPTGHAFNNQTFTRADMFATGQAAALLSGTPQEGKTMTATVAANDADAVLAWQWQRSTNGGSTWANIAGATASTYLVQEVDEGAVLRASVTATDPDNPGASVTAFTGPSGTVVDALPTITVPTIAGVAREGQTLTASATAGQVDNIVTYAWFSSASGYTIQIGSGATYTPQEFDEGFTIEVRATATNEQGAIVSAMSAPTAAVLDQLPTVTQPTITGVWQEGQMLTASATSNDVDHLVNYQWYAPGGVLIGTGPAYFLQEADETRAIYVVATATNDQGVTASSTYAPGIFAADAPPILATPTITGLAQEGQTLFAYAGAWQADTAVTYEWYSNGNPVGSGQTYLVQEHDEGGQIEVVATATNEQGLTVSTTSAPTAVVTDAPPQFLQWPTIINNFSAEEGVTLTVSATAVQDDHTVTYAWYSSQDDFTSPIAFGDSYTPTEADEGRQLGVRATITNDDGVTFTAASNPTGIVMDAVPLIDNPIITDPYPVEGQVLSVQAVAPPEGDTAPIVYFWYSSRDNYTTAIGAGLNYLVRESDEGYSIGVRAIAINNYAPMTVDGIHTSQLYQTYAVVEDGDDDTKDNDPQPPTDGPFITQNNATISLHGGSTIVGSANSISPNGNPVTILGGADTVYGNAQNITASYSGLILRGTDDHVYGSWDIIDADPGAVINLHGTANTIRGDNVSVDVSDAFVWLNGSGDQLYGARDIVALGGDAVVNGDNQVIINVATGSMVTLTGTNDIISAPTNATINLVAGATLMFANGGSGSTINGSGVTIDATGASFALGASNDLVKGTGDSIWLADGSGVTLATAGYDWIYGNGETINVLQPQNTVVLVGDGDIVLGNNVSVSMVDGTSATLVGSQFFVGGDNVTVSVNNATVGIAGATSNYFVGDTIIGNNNQIWLPVLDPASPSMNLTVDGTNNALYGRGENITIADGASISYLTTSDTTVTFAGSTGTLILDGPGSFDPPENNLVAGFRGQDHFDILGMAYGPNTSAWTTDTDFGVILNVRNGSALSQIALLGNYSASSFVASDDGHGGTLITDPVLGLAAPHV